VAKAEVGALSKNRTSDDSEALTRVWSCSLRVNWL